MPQPQKPGRCVREAFLFPVSSGHTDEAPQDLTFGVAVGGAEIGLTGGVKIFKSTGLARRICRPRVGTIWR
jgi:hypothetical protein